LGEWRRRRRRGLFGNLEVGDVIPFLSEKRNYLPYGYTFRPVWNLERTRVRSTVRVEMGRSGTYENFAHDAVVGRFDIDGRFVRVL
jgi:hypothetical protein